MDKEAEDDGIRSNLYEKESFYQYLSDLGTFIRGHKFPSIYHQLLVQNE